MASEESTFRETEARAVRLVRPPVQGAHEIAVAEKVRFEAAEDELVVSRGRTETGRELRRPEIPRADDDDARRVRRKGDGRRPKQTAVSEDPRALSQEIGGYPVTRLEEQEIPNDVIPRGDVNGVADTADGCERPERLGVEDVQANDANGRDDRIGVCARSQDDRRHDQDGPRHGSERDASIDSGRARGSCHPTSLPPVSALV